AAYGRFLPAWQHVSAGNSGIDGLAASMASVIAMVGNPVIMPENTMMMIHKPWGFAGGDANDMRDYAELLDKVESVLI
ncbi:ATP-dependent Clp protease proteolytic subunit, partial [Mycobacterium tuberculosis]|nr:ATP-dependent Clp protease proteolytic subunit [Mycobacterium tuberculosis]